MASSISSLDRLFCRPAPATVGAAALAALLFAASPLAAQESDASSSARATDAPHAQRVATAPTDESRRSARTDTRQASDATAQTADGAGAQSSSTGDDASSRTGALSPGDTVRRTTSRESADDPSARAVTASTSERASSAGSRVERSTSASSKSEEASRELRRSASPDDHDERREDGGHASDEVSTDASRGEEAGPRRRMLLAQNDATGAEGAGDATEGGEAGAGGEGVPQTDVRRSNRMEFDPRLIKGQSAGSGAVFLYQRTPRPLPSMVERRSTFLRATVQSELGEEGASQFDDARRETLEREAREANRDEK